MPAPIGGRLQPSREAVESLLRSRKGTLKAVGSTKESKVQLKEPRLQGYVAKRGEWKTIDQRERSAAKARKTQRRGIGAAVLGGGAAVGTYAAGHDKGHATFLGGNKTWQEAGELTRGAKQVAKVPGVGLGAKAKYLGRAAMARPMGATFIGGLGLAGAGGVGYAQGKVREGYHQSRINARRKANFSRSVGKRAPMDHEPSGFARYGDGSSKGKRLPDEFSKGHNPYGSMRRNVAEDTPAGRSYRHGMKAGKSSVRNGTKVPATSQSTDLGVRTGMRIQQLKDRGISKGLIKLPKAKKAMDLRHGYTDPLANLKLPSKTMPGEASRGQLPPKNHTAVPRAYPKGISHVGKGLFTPKAVKQVAAAGWKAAEHNSGQLAPGKLIDSSKIPFAAPGTKPAKGWGPVGKRVRNKDAESDRQRRLGMGVAATGVGSALLLRRGVGGAIKTSRNLRGLGLQSHKGAWGTTPNEVKQLISHYDKDEKLVRGRGVAMTGRQAMETAGGTALGASALGLEHYSRGQRNRRWE